MTLPSSAQNWARVKQQHIPADAMQDGWIDGWMDGWMKYVNRKYFLVVFLSHS
jgi:hypothetical protein